MWLLEQRYRRFFHTCSRYFMVSKVYAGKTCFSTEAEDKLTTSRALVLQSIYSAAFLQLTLVKKITQEILCFAVTLSATSVSH